MPTSVEENQLDDSKSSEDPAMAGDSDTDDCEDADDLDEEDEDDCLTEQELLYIAETSIRKKSVAETLTSILGSQHVRSVDEDWEGNLVAIFKDEGEVEKLLNQFGSSQETLMGRVPRYRLQAVNRVYSIDCGASIVKGRKVDVRDFFPHDGDCKFDGYQIISSISRAFLGRVLCDSTLRSLYPALKIAEENVRRGQ